MLYVSLNRPRLVPSQLKNHAIHEELEPNTKSSRFGAYYINVKNTYVCYTGVTNYRCTYCVRQFIKQAISQKLINYVLFNQLFIPSMETSDICFKTKLHLLKTFFILLGYPSRYFECPLLLNNGVYVNKCSRKLSG